MPAIAVPMIVPAHPLLKLCLDVSPELLNAAAEIFKTAFVFLPCGECFANTISNVVSKISRRIALAAPGTPHAVVANTTTFAFAARMTLAIVLTNADSTTFAALIAHSIVKTDVASVAFFTLRVPSSVGAKFAAPAFAAPISPSVVNAERAAPAFAAL